MRFTPTPLAGAFVIDVERNKDERGWFGRTYSRSELEANGLDASVAQTSVSFNPRRWTLRGLHYQAAPHQEIKLVRCTRGAICDVIVDLRPASPTYLQSFVIELTAASYSAIYIPGDFAHGFLTLCDDVELLYQISVDHQPTAARGLRWDDPVLAIDWPARPVMINERDATFPLLVKA